jgi:hypothetical protein
LLTVEARRIYVSPEAMFATADHVPLKLVTAALDTVKVEGIPATAVAVEPKLAHAVSQSL